MRAMIMNGVLSISIFDDDDLKFKILVDKNMDKMVLSLAKCALPTELFMKINHLEQNNIIERYQN